MGWIGKMFSRRPEARPGLADGTWNMQVGGSLMVPWMGCQAKMARNWSNWWMASDRQPQRGLRQASWGPLAKNKAESRTATPEAGIPRTTSLLASTWGILTRSEDDQALPAGAYCLAEMRRSEHRSSARPIANAGYLQATDFDLLCSVRDAELRTSGERRPRVYQSPSTRRCAGRS